MSKRKKKRILISLQTLIGLILILSVGSAGAHLSGGYLHDDSAGSWNYSNPDWMAGIPGDRRLSELSIPETHDTMSLIGGQLCETQSLDLETQLESGIRSLDIRLQRTNTGRLQLYHGLCDLGGVFEDVLDAVVDFLERHPKETILLRIAENSCNEPWPLCPIEDDTPFLVMVEQDLQRYLDWIWVPTNVNPTLDEVRGKIVILEHFSNSIIHVESARNEGGHTSLALDDDGNPHISYYDATNGELWYTRRVGDDWETSVIDGFNDMGQYSSLALEHIEDGDDIPYISYYDASIGDLRMAKYVGNSSGNCALNADWYCYIVDGGSENDVGQYSSLALDSFGNPHISYYDADNDDLKYDGQTVDSAGNVGQYSSLDLDDNNIPYISYYDASMGDLRLAKFVGSGGNCGPVNDWDCNVVDGGSANDVGQYSSLALEHMEDGDDLPHISYYDADNNDLKYDGLPVDYGSENDVGQYSSLALDSLGNPHISYYDNTDGKHYLKYAFWDDNSGWIVQTVDYGLENDLRQYSSLALDANNQPHISYYEITQNLPNPVTGDLIYAGPTNICGDGVSAITQFGLKDGLPCFREKVYWSYQDPEEIYREKWWRTKDQLNETDEGPLDRFYINGLNGSGGTTFPYPWFIASGHENSATDADRRETNESCIDGEPPYEDFPCSGDTMLYEGTNELTLTYLIDHPPEEGQPKRWGIIAMDFPGAELIDYIISANHPPEVTASPGTKFCQIGEDCVVTFTATDIARDTMTADVIGDLPDGLQLTSNGCTGLYIQTIDEGNEGADVGRHSSLALDDDGNPHISYYDATDKELWYARRVGDNWETSVIDGFNDMGQYSSLALEHIEDGDDIPHISYYDASMGDLRMAIYVGNSSGNCSLNADWYCYIVDGGSENDVGQYSSLALDSFGNPHISYYDNTDNKHDLKYDGQTVDSAGNVGLYTSLALDDNNIPYISYYDASMGDLRLAKFVGSGGNCGPVNDWDCNVVDGGSANDVGQYSSLALEHIENGDDLPHISYYDADNNDLKYDGLPVDYGSANDVGQYSSLALDSLGNPHISYYDNTDDKHDLKYAFWNDNSGWNIQQVDHGDLNNVGQYSSLALDDDGNPHISYYDNTDNKHDLKYAFWDDCPGWHVKTCEWILEGSLNQPGNYDITVRVTDNNGGTDTAVATIVDHWAIFLPYIFR